MKNFLILGLASLLLFAVAAGLSVWLQQSKQQTEEAKKEEPKKKGIKDDDKEKGEKEKPKDKPEPTAPKGDPLSLSGELKERMAAVQSREARQEKRQSQLELILQDIRVQRESVDKLNKQLTTEAKQALARIEESDVAARPLDDPKKPVAPLTPAKPAAPDPAERKNLERLATMYEAMPAETAGKLIQQLADGGKLDAAVKVLAQMKERSAGKVLAEMPDTTLASTLAVKILEQKRAAVAPAPPAGGS